MSVERERVFSGDRDRWDDEEAHREGLRTDAQLEDDVRSALARDLPAVPIIVRVEAGAVTLGGTVDDPYQRRLAAEAARGVDGIVDVHDEITVAGAPLGP